jgi:hypothetical protein
MVLKSYLIAPFNSGLQKNIEPWLLPEDAFSTLEDAYVWRGRVKKRFGVSLLGSTPILSRFRINVGTTDANGDLTVTVPGTVFAIGQMFTVGTAFYTVNATGTPANLLQSIVTTTATYNTSTGQLVLVGAPVSTNVFFYPSTPVMGLLSRETANVNVEEVIGFDTQFAYIRAAGAWSRLGTAVWTGGNSDFFWSTNYRGTNPYETFFYVVNGIAADGIQYVPQGSTTWVSLRPDLNVAGTRFLETSKILIGFKDRLVALNTIETESTVLRTYINRARFSQNGDPTTLATSWLDDTPGRGGFVDAPVQEAIVTCTFIKDRLIVYFERSTWELVYTGDSTLPFIWQQINTELGAESRFSIIPFDKIAVGVGNVGIHACNGVNVDRIDQKIPDEVFKIHNGNEGVERVYGIRDYYRELVYWTYPQAEGNPVFPTKILVYNYQNQSWAFFNESFTCFGTFQRDSDMTWATINLFFPTWNTWDQPWSGAPSQSQFPSIIAGNQQGYTFFVEADRSSNCDSLYITDMNTAANPQEIEIINHNLNTGDFLQISGAQGISLFQNLSTTEDVTIFKITVIDANTISVDNAGTISNVNEFGWTGTYIGGGNLKRISNLNVISKQWNPGTPIGQKFRMPYIDFFLDKTDAGEVSVDYFIDSAVGPSIQSQSPSNVLLGSNTLFTKPENDSTFGNNQVRIWHRYFLQSQGMMIQIRIYMTDDQMRDTSISEASFQMNGLILYVQPEGRIIG